MTFTTPITGGAFPADLRPDEHSAAGYGAGPGRETVAVRTDSSAFGGLQAVPGVGDEAMTSARVAAFLLNSPRTADVTVSVPGLRTPRIDMHRCSASIITSTPGRVERVDHRVGDLRGEPLLHLRALGEPVDEPGELRQAGDAAVVAGDVRDVRRARGTGRGGVRRAE